MGLKPCLGKSSVALFINLMEEDKCQWKGMSINKNEKMISIDLGIFLLFCLWLNIQTIQV